QIRVGAACSYKADAGGFRVYNQTQAGGAPGCRVRGESAEGDHWPMLDARRTARVRAVWAPQPSGIPALLMLAISVGLATGLGVGLFRLGIEFFHEVFVIGFEHLLGETLGRVTIVVSLAAAGFVVGWLMNRFVGIERYHNVAAIIE